eukprot:364557-Chlamydomonas_euryale.AAC.9
MVNVLALQIYTVHSRPNHFLPWQNHPKRESTGTGFVVHNRMILTNAHVIADSTYVLVKRHGSGTKFKAEVQAVGHDCDLAILSVDDDAFWSLPTAMLPLQLGELPALQQDVVVVGYPTGGDNTSVTSGVVSRVEVAQYVHAATHLMAIQIDAAINPGNSGETLSSVVMHCLGCMLAALTFVVKRAEPRCLNVSYVAVETCPIIHLPGGPALQDDKVVGVAFQNLPHAENIGYIIPTPVVRHFISEVAKYGFYKGYCSLGILCQNLENPHLRRALGMQEGQTGVLVNTVQATSAAAEVTLPLPDLAASAAVIRPGDVLLRFGGVPIANDGTVHLRQRERIYFNYLITLQPTGASGHVTLLRNGSQCEHNVDLHPNEMLVPVHTYDRLPSYYIFAGLVFVPLSQPYLHEYGDDWTNTSPRRLYDKAMHKMMKRPAEQIVVLTQVLSDDVNAGYQLFQNLQVVRVNGDEVLNLAHFRQLVETASSDGFVRFELEDDRLMVVDRLLAIEASDRIAERTCDHDVIASWRCILLARKIQQMKSRNVLWHHWCALPAAVRATHNSMIMWLPTTA